jgi:hypothetical protein
VPFGLDNPVRIAYEHVSKTIGVGFVKEDNRPLVKMDSALYNSASAFRVLDDVTYEGESFQTS